MAQRDYIYNKPKVIRSSQRQTKENRVKTSSPKMLIALAVLIIAVFLAGLYFIIGNAPTEQVEQQRSPIENQLPPPPQERWQYIRNLESNNDAVNNVASSTSQDSEQAGLDALIQHQISQQPGTTTSVPEAVINQYSDIQNEQLIETTQQLHQAQLPTQQQTHVIDQQSTVNSINNDDERILNNHTLIESSIPKIVTNEEQKQLKIAQQQDKLAQEKVQKREAESKILEEKKLEAQKKEAQKLTDQNKVTKTESNNKLNTWQLQCGSFQSSGQAEEVRAKLAFSGIESKISKAGNWNRVMLGPFPNRNTTSDMLQRVKSVGIGNCLILAP